MLYTEFVLDADLSEGVSEANAPTGIQVAGRRTGRVLAPWSMSSPPACHGCVGTPRLPGLGFTPHPPKGEYGSLPRSRGGGGYA
jgi:hypothetical protein